MSARRATLVAVGAIGLAAGAYAVTACVSDNNTQVNITHAEGGAADDAQAGGDGGSASNVDGGSAGCVESCVDVSTLSACAPDGAASPISCPYDCSTSGGAHCRVFTPGAPVTATDVTEVGSLSAVDVAATGFMSSDDGTIDGVRAKNADPAVHEIVSGIAFHTQGAVGIYAMKTFTLEQAITLKVRGTRAVAIVADTITIKGVLDLRGYDANGALCGGNAAGPGGFRGGDGKDGGAGPGGGQRAPEIAPGQNGAGGAAGASYGSDGGAGSVFGGGPFLAFTGPAYPFTTPIVGGSGGGSAPIDSVFGGGGGGAVQLVASTQIAIGGGASPGGINAGGCGGHNGGTTSSGSGGGSGGTIFLEAPTVLVTATGALAANGGAGGSGPGTSDAGAGDLSSNQAIGAGGVANYAYGGSGGAGASLGGMNGLGLAGGTKAGAAGAGSVGRIVIRNRSGTFTVGPSAIVSPVLPSAASTAQPITLQ